MEQSPIDLVSEDALSWVLLDVDFKRYIDYPADWIEVDDMRSTV